MIQIFKPKSDLLQKHIDYFYIFDHERPENISYIAFPHVNSAISFFKGVQLIRGDHEATIIADDQNKTKCVVEILGMYTQPVFVNYIGNCEEVAVVFKPLGVNHFFENDLIEFSPLFTQELENIQWRKFSQELFKIKSIAKKIEMLELFLLSNLIEIKNKKIFDAVKYLEDFETNYSIDKVAELCGYTPKTFQRNFMKYITCTPSEYKRIARFRNAIESKIISNEIKTLTAIGNDSNYYDQSYFIREFKKLTQQNPNSFFKSILTSDQKKIVWKLK